MVSKITCYGLYAEAGMYNLFQNVMSIYLFRRSTQLPEHVPLPPGLFESMVG